ncbi:adenylosuccinate synthetase, partial [Aliarcobacter butzleri]|uniref:adenylosuccinate synthetase n=1 Tax=Aliarcobacter butzleri TaxID=28197 RepID=UPI003B21728E
LFNPMKLCDDILECFTQNRSIFDVLDISPPNKDELVAELNEYKEKLSPCITKTTNLVWKAIDENKRILVEGAQGTVLD